MKTFLLPDLGEGLTESEVVSWRVAEGDSVELNQPLADIETAKAVVELPSPYEGVITKLHAAEGETVAVGAPLIEFDVGAAGGAPAADAPVVDDDVPSPEAGPVATPDETIEETPAAIEPEAKPEKVSVLVGSITVHGGKPVRAKRTWDVAPFSRTERPAERRANRAMPPVRKLAKERGIDLQLSLIHI